MMGAIAARGNPSNRVVPPVGGLTWPRDAEACIVRRPRSVTTSGRARTGMWVLRFERHRPPVVEPLMGWTGGDEVLPQVELTFASREAAVAYAERQDIAYRVEDGPRDRAALEAERSRHAEGRSRGVEEAVGAILWLSALQSQYGRCDLAGVVPEVQRALVDPAAVFAAPDEVARHPALSLDCKRDILTRWAWDEYLLGLASDEAMPEPQPSRLDEVKAALCALERLERTPVLVLARRDEAGAGSDEADRSRSSSEP